MNSRGEDALRRKGTSLLRDWGTCPDCGERGTLQVSIPRSAGRLVLAITCQRNRCDLKTHFPSSFIQRLGAIADTVRRKLELEEKKKTVGDIFRDNVGAGFTWEDLMGRLGRRG